MKYQVLRSFLAIISFFAFAFISWSGATTSAQKGEETYDPRAAYRIEPIKVARPEAVFPGTNFGPIPDGDCNGPGRAISFAATGLSGPPTDVRVNFTGTHTYIGDIDVTL